MRLTRLRHEGRYERYRRDRCLVLAVAVCFSLMFVSFVVSGTITEIQSRRIQREASSISENALLAAEHLIAIRAGLRKLDLTMNALSTSDAPPVVSELATQLEVSRRELATNWAQYLSYPFYPGEKALVEKVDPDLTSVEEATGTVVERLNDGDTEGGIRAGADRALPSIARADANLAYNLELNRREAQAAAMRITASTRQRGLLPEFMGAFFAIALAYFGVRILIRYLAWSAERSAELEQFAGRVAHDIRSPLGSVELTLELVQKNKDIDARTRGLLARVARTMEHIKRLIDDLLVFATAGGYIIPGEVGERKANVREVLDGVVEDASLEAEKRGIQFVYQKPESALVVACGPGVLISIVTNLVSNAMKFIGEAPLRRVTISARRCKKDVRLEVTDTGPGLAPELRERVFQPHVRGTSNEPGFGLGLATVRRLVEVHKGDVGVENGPEGGCRFWIRLPVWTEDREAHHWVLPRVSRATHAR
jgi:signal transduction histidine kinase